jgi:hypothetical protein
MITAAILKILILPREKLFFIFLFNTANIKVDIATPEKTAIFGSNDRDINRIIDTIDMETTVAAIKSSVMPKYVFESEQVIFMEGACIKISFGIICEYFSDSNAISRKLNNVKQS